MVPTPVKWKRSYSTFNFLNFDVIVLVCFSDIYAPLVPFYRARLRSGATRAKWSAYELSIVDFMVAQGVDSKVSAIRKFLSMHSALAFTRTLPAVALKLRDVAKSILIPTLYSPGVVHRNLSVT